MDIIKLYETTFRECWSQPALTDYFTEETLSYGELARKINGMHALLRENGIAKGDRIALIGRNSPSWVAIYVSVITYGAVIVPILPDFNPSDLCNIVEHSESSLLFIERQINEKLTKEGHPAPRVEKIFPADLRDIALPHTGTFSAEDINYDSRSADETIIISYTSGTSGFSKGVMLTDGNISSNVQFALDHGFHFRGSRVLALLPLAHAYGCAFDMLTPLAAGSHITLLGKTPTPAILVKAMKEVRPHLICTVPLVLEKIVRKKVLPELERQPVATLIRIPLIRSIIFRRIRKTMLDSFGGCIREVNTGGAALSGDVESFLSRIGFPFTVGYGMTECGPLIAYEDHRFYKSGSGGRILPGMEVRIDRASDADECGEILVRGCNVMKGYYRNPEATAQAIDSEGWLHTGDVGKTDPDGTIYIKGRCKSMILSGNGQNIYPEEIEFKLNSLPYVSESLVYEEKGRLIALIVPDAAAMKADGKNDGDLKAIMDGNLLRLNSTVASYEQVSEYRICETEFEKTPKKSIRRYLYPKKAIFK